MATWSRTRPGNVSSSVDEDIPQYPLGDERCVHWRMDDQKGRWKIHLAECFLDDSVSSAVCWCHWCFLTRLASRGQPRRLLRVLGGASWLDAGNQLLCAGRAQKQSAQAQTYPWKLLLGRAGLVLLPLLHLGAEPDWERRRESADWTVLRWAMQRRKCTCVHSIQDNGSVFACFERILLDIQRLSSTLPWKSLSALLRLHLSRDVHQLSLFLLKFNRFFVFVFAQQR